MSELIVSLTSYPARIAAVPVVVNSLLAQTKKPDRIILWLAPEQFPHKNKSIPRQVQALTKQGLTIAWYKDIKSYKKLIPALRKYPKAIHITVDDDLVYDRDLIKRLYECHICNPRQIIAHRVSRLYFDNRGKLTVLPRDFYYQNNTPEYVKQLKVASYFNKLTGGAGTLYPPGSLHKDVLNEKLFMTLAPTSDDIWFWLMGVLQKTRVVVPENNSSRLTCVSGTQKNSLSAVNDHGKKLFYVHLQNILQHYPEIKEILQNDNVQNKHLIAKLQDRPLSWHLQHWSEKIWRKLTKGC